MTLASGWFGVQVEHVLAFGVKMEWGAEELAKARAIGEGPVRWFNTQAEAVQRYLRISGLEGLVGADSECAMRGIAEQGGKFRLSMDPRANWLSPPPFERIVAAMHTPLQLATGELDPMTSLKLMRRYDPNAVILPGLGHSPHVESPERLWEFVEPVARRYRSA